MAEAFNKYFYSTLTHAPEEPLDAFTPPDSRMPVLDSLVLCGDDVYKVLLNLDPSKAPGPDGLPTMVLRTCARELTPSLCALFNLSLAEGKLPTEWKDALVVPVHKKGKKEDVTNYRPIPLLCVVYKVLKGLVHDNAHARRLSLQNKFVGSTLNSKSPLPVQSLKILRFIRTSVALAGLVILR